MRAEEEHAALTDLYSYPLISALQQRRTRRVARGVSINARRASHESANEPEPLTPLEEAILIVTTGVTGLGVLHDGPTVRRDGRPELETPFLYVLARTGSSPDNAQATSFFVTSDEGTWLIKKLAGRRAREFVQSFPTRWSDWTEQMWLDAAEVVKHKLYDDRIEYPRHYPYYLNWNNQHSNAPGTTVFIPVVDCTYQYINAMFATLGHPADERPLYIDDFRHFRPRSMQDWVAWAAAKLRLIDPIPYQPVGGIKMAKSGDVNAENFIPLGYGRTLRTDYEAFFLLQNLMLVAEALGLGAWIHASIFEPYIFQRDEASGFRGLGFREHGSAVGEGRWAPLPAAMPNFVGIDGVLEGLCPPYMSTDEAVDRVLEMKFGPDGAYGDAATFGHSYRTQSVAEAYLENVEAPPKEVVAYVKQICRYIYETYGRFPAHNMAFHSPGVWLQLSHLELEYYEKVADPSFFSRQARHDDLWHPDDRSER